VKRFKIIRSAELCVFGFWVAALGSPALAQQGVNFQATVIFPPGGQYIYGGSFVLSSPITPVVGNFDLMGAGVQASVTPGIQLVNVACEIGDETFVVPPLTGDIAPATAQISISPPVVDPMTGRETIQTQILALDISGGQFPPNVDLRVSPTIPSTGTTTFDPLPGGGFHINSFFDIFTELSLDGGQTWTPSTGSSRAMLTPLPEPSSVVLLGVGMAVVLFARLRRHTR
jgi:hypothetical protein